MQQLYRITFIFLFSVSSVFSPAQVSLTGSSYTQSFDGLASSGTNVTWTDNTTIQGWYSTRTVYNTGTGTSNAGSLYSFGSTSDRALGSLASGGTATIYYGVRLKNNTSQSISSIQVNYQGEQWRNGGNTTPHSLVFYYQVGAIVTSLTSGVWMTVPTLNFTGPVATSTAAALDGNTNSVMINSTLTSLAVAPGQEIMLRWEDVNDAGNDHGLAIDDITLTITYSSDSEAPQISSLSPLNRAVGISVNPTASITFNENIQPGTGNIYVKRISDNNTVQTLSASSTNISGGTASFTINGLAELTDYYIQIDNGAFKDFADNNFTGISDNSTWRFQTQGSAGSYSWNFNSCTNPNLDGGFTQYSVETGQINDSVWQCTDFGRGTGKALQINAGTTGLANQDWLISPSLNLASYTIPLLKFYSRTRFEGAGLSLKISTNYSGSGNPAAAAWVDLAGKFPDENTDRWTLSDSINLSDYKQAGIYLAWVYNSSNDESPRWQIDDLQIFNSGVSPSPYVKIFNYFKNLGVATVGSPSSWRKIIFDASDLISNLVLTAPSNFEISENGTTASSSIILTAAQANGAKREIYTRLAPSSNNSDFTDSISFNSAGVSKAFKLYGSSQTGANTLDIVAWNIEWFGGSQGPADDDLQQANVLQSLQNLNADIYALEEVVNITRLNNLVSSLPEYSYVISDYTSLAPDPGDPNYATGQKLALVYKTSVISNITARGLMKSSATANSNWASGRVPFLVNADVTLNGTTRNINLIVIHGKAGDLLSDFNARKAGADELKDTLDVQFSTANIILLGDYNDDLDITISAPSGAGPATSYNKIVSDSTDSDSYGSISLPLSYAGLRSTKANSDVIDHIILSNELSTLYSSGSAQIRKDMEDLITNYSVTTSDHYPVIARFNWAAQTPVPIRLNYFVAKQHSDKVQLRWSTAQEANCKEFIIERSNDANNFISIGRLNASGNSIVQKNYELLDEEPFSGNNFYRLKQIDNDGTFEYSKIVKVVFEKNTLFTFAPNPAKNTVLLNLEKINEPVTVQLIDGNGRIVKQRYLSSSATQTIVFDLHQIAKGIYMLKAITRRGIQSERLVLD